MAMCFLQIELDGMNSQKKCSVDMLGLEQQFLEFHSQLNIRCLAQVLVSDLK